MGYGSHQQRSTVLAAARALREATRDRPDDVTWAELAAEQAEQAEQQHDQRAPSPDAPGDPS